MSVTTEKVVVQVSVDGQVTLVSSVSSALGAASSAAVAQAAAAAALISETNADASEAAAAVSAAAALVSEGNADTSEANAAASAAAALISEGNADASAGAAATSASDALTSANNADVSEAAAAASAAAALVSQNAAAASAASAATATETLVEGGTLDASFASIKSSGDIVLAGTKKFYVDGVGGVGGDTYIAESSANVVDHYAGGVLAVRLGSSVRLDVNRYSQLIAETGATNYGIAMIRGGNYTLSASQRGLLDIEMNSTALVDTGPTLTFTNNVGQFGQGLDWVGGAIKVAKENATNTNQANYFAIYTNNASTLAERMRLTSGGNLAINSTGKLYLDGVAASGDTYLVESSANVLDVYTGGARVLSLTATGAAVIGTLSATGIIQPSATESMRVLTGNEISFGHNTAGLGVGMYYNAGDDGINFYNRTGGLNSFRILRTGGISTFGVISGTLPDNTWGTRIITASGECQLSGWITAMGGPAIRAVNLGGGAYTPLNVDGSLVYLRASGNIVGTVSSTGLAVAATGKLYLDGGGDTYLVESSANVLDIYAGGVKTLSLATTGATVTGSVTASANALIAGGVRIDPSSGVTKAWLYRDTSAADRYYFASNWVGSQENLAYPSWGVLLDSRVAGDVLQIRRAPAGGEMATIASFSSTGVTVTGIVDASDVVSTSGGVGLRLRYGTTDFLNIFGSMYSSGATLLGYGVRSSTTTGSSFTSTSAAAAHPRGALTMDNALRFWQANASTIAVGAAATLTETFTITTLGDMVTVATKKHYLDGASGAGGDTYLVESSANVLDTYVGGVNTLKSTPILTTVTGALSAPDLTVTVVDKTIFSATIVDTFLYDTSKDSDGGAWRKRCSHTSWENETLSGNWLGSAANETAARAISGATTGSYYYDTTAAGFYTLNAGSGKTATYRGNVRQFPAQVLITVEAARVVIWDITQAGAPMWMVFASPTNNESLSICPATAVAAANGVIAVTGTFGLNQFFFIRDRTCRVTNTGTGWSVAARISDRNSTVTASGGYYAIVNIACNDVAMTVLPNAPVDVATGLPVPTIAVATNGGVSVIKDDGTVVNWLTIYGIIWAVRIGQRGSLLASGGGGVAYESWYRDTMPTNSPDNNTTYRFRESSVPARPGTDGNYGATNKIEMTESVKAFGSSFGGLNVVPLILLRDNPATPTKGMAAYITKDYNSGWQVGSIKGAWLADTVAETLTGTELVTNGTFATDATGWTALNGAGLSVASGELTVTNAGATYGAGYQTITTVIGKTYVASCTARCGTASPVTLGIGVSAGGTSVGYAQTTSTSNVPLAVTFIATGTTTYISLDNDLDSGGTGIWDNITCRLADVDRSVKAKGLQIHGSLTKAAVASGAELVGYSGFSAANYLEQPYNSDLDFGTGDFHFMGWIKESANTALERIISRGSYSGGYSGSAIHLLVHTSGVIDAYVTDDAFVSYDRIYSTAAIDDGVWRLVVLLRRGGNLELWLNDAKASADVPLTNAAGSLSNASAVTRIGLLNDGTEPLTHGTLALWRAGATAPSAEQIKHIYETEKALFEANAQCCLAGTSNAVTALAYDDVTDLLHVGTSYGRSAFKGLVRASSEATPVGAITALSAGGGFIAQGGASGADIYIPAYTLREELSRRAEQAARLGSALEPITFTATSLQTAFAMSVGWTPKYVYRNGLLLREGSAEDYTLGFDGFLWTVTLADASVSGDHITVMGVRSNG